MGTQAGRRERSLGPGVAAADDYHVINFKELHVLTEDPGGWAS
jgi:hypothetical protein